MFWALSVLPCGCMQLVMSILRVWEARDGARRAGRVLGVGRGRFMKVSDWTQLSSEFL